MDGKQVAVYDNQTDAIVAVIERAAANPAIDVEKMERLLAMQERVLARNAEAEFNSAMAEMQERLPDVTEKGAIVVNGEVRSKYATFEDINDVAKPVLARYGFAMSFRVKIEGSAVAVTGILMHRSGHREETTMVLPADTSGLKNSVQALGSSTAYGKRYVMCALLNITTRGEDDDGKKGGVKPISEVQLQKLRDMLLAAEKTEASFCKWLHIETLEDLPEHDFKKAFAALKQVEAKK